MAGFYVLLLAPARERPRKNEGPTPLCANTAARIFPRINKTPTRNSVNTKALLYLKLHHDLLSDSLITEHSSFDGAFSRSAFLN